MLVTSTVAAGAVSGLAFSNVTGGLIYAASLGLVSAPLNWIGHFVMQVDSERSAPLKKIAAVALSLLIGTIVLMNANTFLGVGTILSVKPSLAVAIPFLAALIYERASVMQLLKGRGQERVAAEF